MKHQYTLFLLRNDGETTSVLAVRNHDVLFDLLDNTSRMAADREASQALAEWLRLNFSR